MKFNLSIDLPDDTITGEDILAMCHEDSNSVEVTVPDNIEVIQDDKDVHLDIHSDEHAENFPFAYGNVVRIIQKMLCLFNEDLDDAVYPSRMVIPYLTELMDGMAKFPSAPKLLSVDYNYGSWSNEEEYAKAKKQSAELVLEIRLPDDFNIPEFADHVAKRFPDYFCRDNQHDICAGYVTEDWFTYTPQFVYGINMQTPIDYPVDDVDKSHPSAKPIGFAQGVLNILYEMTDKKDEEK
jgi:hypothetical protein